MKCSECKTPVFDYEMKWLKEKQYQHFYRVCDSCYSNEPKDNI